MRDAVRGAGIVSIRKIVSSGKTKVKVILTDLFSNTQSFSNYLTGVRQIAIVVRRIRALTRWLVTIEKGVSLLCDCIALSLKITLVESDVVPFLTLFLHNKCWSIWQTVGRISVIVMTQMPNDSKISLWKIRVYNHTTRHISRNFHNRISIRPTGLWPIPKIMNTCLGCGD